jgi:hypothetical protein
MFLPASVLKTCLKILIGASLQPHPPGQGFIAGILNDPCLELIFVLQLTSKLYAKCIFHKLNRFRSFFTSRLG